MTMGQCQQGRNHPGVTMFCRFIGASRCCWASSASRWAAKSSRRKHGAKAGTVRMASAQSDGIKTDTLDVGALKRQLNACISHARCLR